MTARALGGLTLVTHSAAETRAAGRVVGALLEPGDLVVLGGDLGTGKTVFTKGIAEGLGVDATVVSPTFTLAREYEGRLRLVHVDVYRLDRIQEFLDLGLEDLAGDDAVTVVEWGDAVAAELPADHLEIRLRTPGGGDGAADDDRELAVRPHGARWQRRAGALRAELAGAA